MPDIDQFQACVRKELVFLVYGEWNLFGNDKHEMIVEDELFDVFGLAEVDMDLFFLVVFGVVAVVHVAFHDHFLAVEKF
jgi:hypothetical protein